LTLFLFSVSFTAVQVHVEVDTASLVRVGIRPVLPDYLLTCLYKPGILDV